MPDRWWCARSLSSRSLAIEPQVRWSGIWRTAAISKWRSHPSPARPCWRRSACRSPTCLAILSFRPTASRSSRQPPRTPALPPARRSSRTPSPACYRLPPMPPATEGITMALLIKAEELQGLITIPDAIAAVRDGFRDQGEKPAYSAPRIRIQHEDRRVSVHQGGCHRLQVAGMFIHVERFTFRGGAQQYAHAGKRVYVAYDSETAELKCIVIGSLPLFDEPPEDWFGTETPITGAVGTDILARPDCRVLGLYGTGRQARRHLIAMCTI